MEVQVRSVKLKEGVAEVDHPAKGDIGELLRVPSVTIFAATTDIDVIAGEPALDEVCLGECLRVKDCVKNSGRNLPLSFLRDAKGLGRRGAGVRLGLGRERHSRYLRWRLDELTRR